MPRIDHVKLLAHKGLKEAILSDLGRINIVCGPNNSGKTTVLECLADQRLRVPGSTISPRAVEEISLEALKSWLSNGGNSNLGKLYLQHVQKGLGQQGLWFTDQIDGLVAQIDWTLFKDSAAAALSLREALSSRFPAQPSAVLLPSTRRLETSKPIDAADPILPDGTGVLNWLFMAKNQTASTDTRRQFDALRRAFEGICREYTFDISINQHPQQPSLNCAWLHFCRAGSKEFLATDCGMGLQQVLLILYFTLVTDTDLVLIEDPEDHLHPDLQRRLINFLREKTEKQFFLSTHSSVFLSTSVADCVFSCRMTDSVQVENVTSHATLLTDLGYSIADNLVADVVILSEGPKDRPVLEEFLRKMGVLGHHHIKIWALSGDIIDQIDLSVLARSCQAIAVVGNDVGNSHARTRFESKCREHKINVLRLERCAIENYFTLGAISTAMPGHKIPEGLTLLDYGKRVSDQVGFDVTKHGGRIAQAMTLEDIKGTDFEQFLKGVETLAAG